MAQQIINVDVPNSGLGDTLRNSQIKVNANFTELYANKVDKITGKSLSDTNFTQLEKDKLAGLETGGQVQSDFTEGNVLSKAFIKNKPVNVSQFFNNSQYIADVQVVGSFMRSAGEWISPLTVIAPKIMDGIIGVTTGFIVGQTTFTLPIGAKCIDLFINDQKVVKITTNNASRVSRWSQTGDVVTITKTTVLNNYIYIEYLL